MKTYNFTFLKVFFVALFGLWSVLGFGQTELLNEDLRSGSLPTGWTQTNVSFQTAAEGYARFDETNSVLTTPIFDATAFTAVEVNFYVAKWGSGGDGPITIEYSLNGGSSWIVQGDSSTPNNPDYDENTIIINSVSSNVLIRFTRQNSPSRKRLRDVIISGIGSSNDTDSKILIPTPQVTASTIISDEVDLLSTSQAVLRFQVQDLASGDGLPTEISQISFVPGINDNTNWSQVIQGVRVNTGGTNIASTNQTEIITDTEIIVTFNHGEPNVSNNMTVSDGSIKEFEIRVYLEENNIVAGEIIQLKIEQNNINFQTLASGSGFESNFDAPIIGNNHTISIPNRKLQFIQQPQTTVINENMNLPVQVAFMDNNNNINNLELQNVTIISGGILNASPITVAAVNGIANFPTIVHNALASNIFLTASNSTLGLSEESILFSIIDAVELIISEVVDPRDEFSGRYVELFNSGVSTIDFDTNDYYIVRESNGGTAIFSIQLMDSIPAKGYYTIGRGHNNAFFSNYNFDPDLSDPEIAETIAGNGDDSYFISTNVSDGNEGRNSIIDLYGAISVDGTGEPWEYEDSRAFRDNPTVKNASNIWDPVEWTIQNNANIADMTPGYGDNDYIYDGAWTNIGLGDPIGSSTTSQNIFVRSGTATLTNDTEIGDLVVRSGATLELEPGVKLTIDGDIVNEGTIIFESGDGTTGDISTAVLEQVNDNTRVVGNGFEVHRRIPIIEDQRAFRYLSSSVTTPTVAQGGSIFDNWQEGGTAPTGQGTHITGAIGPVGNVSPDGFDFTPSGNPSMFSYNPNLGNPWQSVPNTNSTTFSVGDAYAILIRGDRTSPLNTNDQTGPSTTLRTTGKIHVGNFEVPTLSNTVGHFNLVGNPYQSQVDLNSLLSNSTGVDKNFAYVWDPTLGSLGGYAVLDLSSIPINNPTTIIDFGAPTPSASDANQYLQPQQAFFVETKGPNPVITFTEDDKDNSGTQTTVFSAAEEEDISAILDISLKDVNHKTYDGVRIMYNSTYNDAIDQNDAIKFWNYTDHLSVFNNDNFLSIEKRNLPSSGDVTPLYFGAQSLGAYSLEMLFYSEEDFNAFLVDNYTGQTLAIPQNSEFAYSFTVDTNIPESIANDRFELTYENTPLSIEDVSLSNFSIYPNPLESGESLYIQSERSLSSKITRVELLNLNGQVLEVLKQSALGSENNLTKLDFESSPVSGIYLLKVTTNQNVVTSKIIIR